MYKKLKLEVVVVASALDDMKAERRLAVVSRSLPWIYTHLSKVNMYNIIIFVPEKGTLPYLLVFFLAFVVERLDYNF